MLNLALTISTDGLNYSSIIEHATSLAVTDHKHTDRKSLIRETSFCGTLEGEVWNGVIRDGGDIFVERTTDQRAWHLQTATGLE
jgi:hypothetical protein